jgi:hypothetical protein
MNLTAFMKSQTRSTKPGKAPAPGIDCPCCWVTDSLQGLPEPKGAPALQALIDHPRLRLEIGVALATAPIAWSETFLAGLCAGVAGSS